MQKRILPLAVTAVLLISLISSNCTKLDTTDIGSDQLPVVDNVNTFADTLLINTTQGYFNDSTTIGKYDDYAVGSITNDPLFGPTTANIYMQLKPPFYPYHFGNPGDTIVGFDSVVLCLKYAGFWGDSLLPVGLEVREVSDKAFNDSASNSTFIENTTAYRPNVSGTVLGTANIDARKMGDTIYLNNRRDKVINQIRIKLSSSWAAQLFNRDSTKSNSVNNAFYNDSIYRSFYYGIAVIASGAGNGLLYATLSDTATKIEVHYRTKNGGKVDSVYSSLRLNPSREERIANRPVSNTSNYISRGRNGFPVRNPAASEHYIQTAPGTFVNLNIPGLASLSNRIIHRAEIIVEQIPTDPVLDEKLSAPNFLYLDLKDTGAIKWKTVYFDLNTSEIYNPDNPFSYIPSQINYQYFGGYRRSKTDPLTGNLIKYYTFNISRYVQQIVTEHTPVYDMRLYAPFNLNYPQHSFTFIPFGNNIAFGRVRVGSGTNPNYRLRLRIVYSKL
ncbi:MAG: DUF4270 family protein [Chitinophagaceae bacterium]|nr:DUF4270 family protein [Chitinophagaceae bacterium]